MFDFIPRDLSPRVETANFDADSRGVAEFRAVYSPRIEQHPASFTADNVPSLSLSLSSRCKLIKRS